MTESYFVSLHDRDGTEVSAHRMAVQLTVSPDGTLVNATDISFGGGINGIVSTCALWDADGSPVVPPVPFASERRVFSDDTVSIKAGDLVLFR